MTFHDKPKNCKSCNETLPRAALGRCPFCRTPLTAGVLAYTVTCRLCRSPIPRAGAGKCPVCATREGRMSRGARR